ncbi:MAG TPA: hypothetical protein PKA21_08865 [Kiritimatiellia bacterium]|nr:hypothetical protein [Kiritimatiellia bacterium]HMP35036.1 hypothetical protein [Kiritimatiellia bacterium]
MPVESIKLSDFFGSIKKPRYVLGTTYTLSLAFFESVVFPYIDRSRLRSCFIIADKIGYQRAISEAAALQSAGNGYMVAPAPRSGCFHPKVWLVIGESEMAMLVGSGNLTQSGFMVNAEYFDSVFISKEEPADERLVRDIESFVAGLAGMWGEGNSAGSLYVETLDQIRRAITVFRGGQAEEAVPRLIHSFSGKLIDGLPEVPDCTELYAAAPFFGGKDDGLRLLASRYPKAKLHVFPAVHGAEATDLPITKVKEEFKPKTLATLRVPGKARPLAHLKLYGIKGSSASWMYCTSANCTAAAWSGPNVEAGLLRPVGGTVLKEYFRADKTKLPSGELEYSGESDSVNNFSLTASESGLGLELVAAGSERDRLPITDVRLTVRVGSHSAVFAAKTLFAGHGTEHVSWDSFVGWHRTRNMAVCLELIAKDKAGKPVSAACFVENRMLLTADPIHRSAWRGALALLDSESMPDLSDIAAIFTLVGNIFDGRIITRSVSVRDSDSDDIEPDEEEESSVHVAIWPPQPVHHDLQRQLGTTGIGQLQWCQRILQTFLKPESAQEGRPKVEVHETADDADDEESAEIEAAREAEREQLQRLADRIWSKAEKDYGRLTNRLLTLEPDEKVAENLWPAAVFVFLATMAVRRAASRMANNVGDIPAAAALANEFLYLMVNPREQHENFCCSRDMRYRHTTFPPLSKDLRDEFNITIHPDLSTVMLAVVAQKKMREAPNGEYPLLWPRLLGEVVGEGFNWDEGAVETCRHVWRQYLREDTSKETDEEFMDTLLWLKTTRNPL